jgi:hypothetical protein
MRAVWNQVIDELYTKMLIAGVELPDSWVADDRWHRCEGGAYRLNSQLPFFGFYAANGSLPLVWRHDAQRLLNMNQQALIAAALAECPIVGVLGDTAALETNPAHVAEPTLPVSLSVTPSGTAARRPHRNPTARLRASQFAPYVDAFAQHLAEGRYASYTVGSHLGCLAHFERWTSRCRLNIRQIDEEAVRRFLDDHLPRCNCAKPVRVDRRDLRAALGHWLVVLRAKGVIAEPPVGTTPVDEELRCFDEHMRHVRGLAPKTRSMRLRTVRRLLIEQFRDQPIVLSSIKPDDLRSFVARQSELYSTPASVGTLAAAL